MAYSETVTIVRQTVESTTLPVGLTVSGLTFLGITLDNWVFVGTAILLTCNLIITIPKAYRFVKGVLLYAKSKGRK